MGAQQPEKPEKKVQAEASAPADAARHGQPEQAAAGTASPARGNRTDLKANIISGVVGGVLTAALLGGAVWLVEIPLGMADLKGRSADHDVMLTEIKSLLKESARQLNEGSNRIARLEQILPGLETQVSRFINAAEADRRETREDLRELRAITLENATAIKDLIAAQRQPLRQP
jgi:hypothetical protein